MTDLAAFLDDADVTSVSALAFDRNLGGQMAHLAIPSNADVRTNGSVATFAGASTVNGSSAARAARTPMPDASPPSFVAEAAAAPPSLSRQGQRQLLFEVADQLRSHEPLEVALSGISRTLLGSRRVQRVAVFEWSGRTAMPRAMAAAEGLAMSLSWADQGLMSISREENRRLAVPTVVPLALRGGRPPSTLTVYLPIGIPEPWGVLAIETASEPASRDEQELLESAARAIEAVVTADRLEKRATAQRRRADALSLMTEQINSKLELPSLMRTLVDEAAGLFDGDQAGIWRVSAGQLILAEQRGLSDAFVSEFEVVAEPSWDDLRIGNEPVVYRDPSSELPTERLREVARRELIETIAIAPVVVEGDVSGLVVVAHDRVFEWTQDDLELLSALTRQAGIAVTNARNYGLMATWAAQLQSIQQLGTRLNRWGTVAEIGNAIASELRELIDYHNVRVYRVSDEFVEPVAWRGEIGEYTDEERDQLRLKIGAGITGWVALHGVAQYLPDAAHDPRSQTIPGTEDGLSESMLVAPMLYEDRVIGVIVLSKLGINQFTVDDLRYLEIYASIAAQAMVNADSTEQLREQSDRLARQLSSQQELMRVTESILSTLDPRTVVEQIADRLSGLLRVDNIAIGVHDEEAGLVRTLFARGTDADAYRQLTLADTTGMAGWVLEHGQAVLIPHTADDPRFLPFGRMTADSSAIFAPLRYRDRVAGILWLERLGADEPFSEEEFELLQLFAGHVSIALQNAQAHQAMEIRAQTDSLTGLKNQGTFRESLELAVARRQPFSLLIVDLDDFKSFNDSRGHEAGNVLLTEIAAALRRSCRDADEVFRYGGDEFALILPSTDETGAIEVATKVGRAVRRVRVPGTQKAAGVTCSIGIAGFPVDGADMEQVLLAADRACYVAKSTGRNRATTASKAMAVAGEVYPTGPTPFDDPDATAEATRV